jgi:hypothetical protein
MLRWNLGNESYHRYSGTDGDRQNFTASSKTGTSAAWI